MAKRLANETSPYLLQHAHNPVEWYPWGPEALERAKREDKPIFLSIGYAACHWCHVMERESFEDAATAEDLNRDFVAVKVDREERPDLDQVYMAAVQAMTGQGGWPMSVFLTPDGKPFYGGTYFPPQPAHGMPAFRQVLAGVARAWRDERLEVQAAGSRLVDALVRQQTGPPSGASPSRALLDAATAAIEEGFDTRNGGWGSAPKFPQPMTIEYLLRRAATGGDPRPLAVARRSLDAMADRGIRDQLGGGFHRYATDAIWLVPHFEQMLYDNAQLARVYVHAFARTGDMRYREAAVGTLDYMIRELRRDDGSFAASQDADTEGVEGATFTWTAAEIREVLGDEAPLFTAAYDVSDEGNWEGRTILRRITPRGDADHEAHLAAARERLLSRRAARAQPARDDKALAAWNGLAIAAFADAARLLPGETAYLEIAETAARAITDGLLGRDGRLGRSWKDNRATGAGVLEDYADLADGLLALYEASFDETWFRVARGLADSMLARFADPAGGFFDTADDHETLVTRPRDVQDNAVPSGGSMAASVLLRLAALTGEARYRIAAEGAIGTVTTFVARYPTAFAGWLSAIHLAVEGIDELAIVGDPSDPAALALAAVASEGFRPGLVLALAADPAASDVPLLADRTLVGGRPTAYLCRNFACRMPVTDPAALREQLGASDSASASASASAPA
ncbi:MAG TPA: thioredoxin domain-containing protein [Candidatus Limnocylindrales bacterium]|nr:thioredoxin domain-containing protein [Candidatus Limnocylindrales bacterium]